MDQRDERDSYKKKIFGNANQPAFRGNNAAALLLLRNSKQIAVAFVHRCDKKRKSLQLAICMFR